MGGSGVREVAAALFEGEQVLITLVKGHKEKTRYLTLHRLISERSGLLIYRSCFQATSTKKSIKNPFNIAYILRFVLPKEGHRSLTLRTLRILRILYPFRASTQM